MYCPERDIAYLAPILMQMTTNSFYEGGKAKEELNSLPEEDRDQLVDFVMTISEFCKKFMRGERTFEEAMKDGGLDNFSPAIRDLWMKHFAHTVLSAFYYGARSAMIKDSDELLMPYEKIFDSAEELRSHL